MSLKTFHIFFITLSAITAFGFGAWLIDGYSKVPATNQLVGGIISIIAGFGLIMYGIRFLKKLKHVRFL